MSNAFIQRSGEDAESAPIYLASVDDLQETGRAIGISLLGVEPAGPALFLPESGRDLRELWSEWLEGAFEARLGEPFVEIYRATGEMRNRRIARLDREITTRLTDVERDRSLDAAVPFYEGMGEIRRLPQWSKFLRKIRSGETPGNVTSLFALRAAVFHLPLLPALVSYLYFEWRSGAGSVGDLGEDRLSPEIFQARFPEGIETARRRFDNGPGGNQLESI